MSVSSLYRRLRRGLTMAETALVISVGGLILVAVVAGAVAIMERINAGSRASEVREIVEAVWERYRSSADYSAVNAVSMAAFAPPRMTNNARDQLHLGADFIPVFLSGGAAAQGPRDIGAHSERTFMIAVGDTLNPIRSASLCDRLVNEFSFQDRRFRGFQIVVAQTASRAAEWGGTVTAPPVAAVTNLTVNRNPVNVAGTAPITGTAADPTNGTAPNMVTTAGPFRLEEVDGGNIAHACDIAADLPAGARIYLAFS